VELKTKVYTLLVYESKWERIASGSVFALVHPFFLTLAGTEVRLLRA
jgi:hypothetical protein